MIYEERDFHVCSSIKNTRIEGVMKWVFDGQKWYPLKLKTTRSDGFLQGEQSDADYTAPMKDGFKYHIRFLMIR